MNARLPPVVEMTAPPHSLEAEQSVLGGLMIDNDAIERIGGLKDTYFYREDHRAIYAEIVRCISRGQPADVISIWDGLQARGGSFIDGLLPYLNQIAQNTPSAANVGRYAGIVTEKALLRGLLHVTSKAEEMAHHPAGKSADQVLDTVQSMVSTLAERRARNEPRLIRDLLPEFVERTDQQAQGLTAAMPTAIASMDHLFKGGLRGGQLVIIAGRPSQGKTALAVDVGLNIASAYSVLMFSLEMSAQELVSRSVANRGRFDVERLAADKSGKDVAAWDALTASVSQLDALKFGVDETPAITLLELRMKAKAWKRRHGLEVIIVDYIGLMTGGDGEKRHEQIGSYSRGLKALAKELDVAVIALAQLNRKSEERVDRRPVLSDLRDSGEIEQDADIVMLVHRPEMHDPNNSELDGYAEVLVRKQRSGRLGDLVFKFDGPTCKFLEWQGPRPQANAPSKTYRRSGLE